MIGMDLVTEIVKTVILTGRVKNSDVSPVSLLLIAPPEHGKTTVVLEPKCKYAVNLTDVTGRGLKDMSVQLTEVTHIVLLDLLMATSHSRRVNQYLMANMNAIAEEGFIGEATPAGMRTMSEPVKKGFICCLTPRMAKDGRQSWNKIGFSSRMLPFNYIFSNGLKDKIRSHINHPPPERVISLIGFKVPDALIPVRLGTNAIREIDLLAKLKSEQLGDDTGFRRLKQFRALACAHAIFRSWKKPEVAQKDIDFLERIGKYISYSKGSEL